MGDRPLRMAGAVQMPHDPVMHRQIPAAPVHVEVLTVPPVPVEEPVPEAQQLAADVESGVEQPVEHQQPAAAVGQRDLQESAQ